MHDLRIIAISLDLLATAAWRQNSFIEGCGEVLKDEVIVSYLTMLDENENKKGLQDVPIVSDVVRLC